MVNVKVPDLLSFAFTGVNDTSSSLLGAIVILVLFLLVLVGAYFTTRFLGNVQTRRTKYANLRVIEAIQVGPGKTVQLVKVGEKYLIIGVTKDTISSLGEIEAELVNTDVLNKAEATTPPFSQYLNNIMSKSKKNK